MKVGFIGLGTMGFPMCSNLSSAGHGIIVFDSNSATLERAAELEGAAVVDSPEETARGADVVFTVLPNDQIVREVYLGDGGIAAGAHSGLVTCDCSTVKTTSAPLAVSSGLSTTAGRGLSAWLRFDSTPSFPS